MVQAVLFDLDETLILDHPVSLHALQGCAFYAASWYSLDIPRLVQAAEEAAVRLWRAGPAYSYTQRIGHSAGEGLWARYTVQTHPALKVLSEWAPDFRVAVWQEALGEQRIRDQALCEALAHRYLSERRLFPRYPEVDALLERLRGYKLGLVTNGVPDLQREKLTGASLQDWFQAVAVSGELDVGKPEQGIFEHICRELNVEPSACVMVGDNPERDIAGALRAGMRSVWVNRGFKPKDPRYQADLEVSNLLEMLPWLETL
ncbi:MAG: HAD-IA family hydrolase [Meiothermus sp.]|uniref:HAD family hydrolase n=1 Tax=Meiothermus sp. TaxID=1955249 RepID=UPI0025F35396|nr:HAD-IA family hydrolase [Meiothermus sp.]MCS7194430.1 HAD-IA family hydrolase [Meiothermus sp.]MCX7739452.1 HAD-IA family hydrolase [Meiothermus sp.]MDW8091090.1 HAD-IA family hydrolase [Meiothermus sp.]